MAAFALVHVCRACVTINLSWLPTGWKSCEKPLRYPPYTVSTACGYHFSSVPVRIKCSIVSAKANFSSAECDIDFSGACQATAKQRAETSKIVQVRVVIGCRACTTQV